MGYAAGPEGRTHDFTSCAEKLELRGKLWQALPKGLHGACMAYNTYCASLPIYHVQSQDPTVTLLDAEKTLRKCFSGPGNWCIPNDLWHLSRYGFPRDARKFATLATAAQVRTAVWEHWPQEEPPRWLRARRIQGLLDNAMYWITHHWIHHPLL